ncbi:MAG: RelA/SpoT family protein [Bacteroidaceae bacterium]
MENLNMPNIPKEETLSQEELKELADDKLIQDAFDDLLKAYLATKHRKRVERITSAFNFAKQAHRGVKRKSGEPYILHPISVAKIVCSEIGLGSTSVCAALLHDVVEDTDYTVEDIENIFGSKIAQLVDGLTKISGGIFGDKASAQAENFKKLLLTMNDDIRVILIKMADRLHNMRTLGSMAANKQYKIAGETLYIYAPLANRLGINKIKTELENLSFKYEHPEAYADIEEKLKASEANRDESFEKFTQPVCEALNQMGLTYQIKKRVKSVYSIWNKMQTKHLPFEEVYDLMAVRIIFEPKEGKEETNLCFAIYLALSKIYKPHPDRLRDWVSRPKANGYQALHVTLMSNEGQWIEVQIRSTRMDEIAEQGFAAHWKYKEGTICEDEGELEKWLKTIKEILDNPQPNAIDFLDTIKLNLFASEIFVFTPKGEIKTMPQNCTTLDFAFSIHSYVGSHCIGAKVNHKLVPLSYKLQSGDQVEILTSKAQRVKPIWATFVTTARAKQKIGSILNKELRAKEKRGEEILTNLLKEEDLLLEPSIINKLCKLHQLESREQLFAAIGDDSLKLRESDLNELKDKATIKGWKRYIPLLGVLNKTSKNKEEDKAISEKVDPQKVLYLTEELLREEVKMAPCCKPIPGDDILGYVDEQKNILIHKRQCSIATKLKSSYGNRIIAVKWNMKKEMSFPVNIYLKGIDERGILNQITRIISLEQALDIRQINIDTNDGIFEANMIVHVHDVEEVKFLIHALHRIKSLKEIKRIDE